jgi:WD40 repeat protein
LEGHTQRVTCISFSPNGKFLASGSGDQLIRLWKLDDQSHRLLEGHNGTVTSIAFSPSGSSLASVSHGCGEVRLWAINAGRCTRIFFTRKNQFVESVAFSPDGATLATGGDIICLWDLEADHYSSSRSSILAKDVLGMHFEDVVYSPNGNFLASLGCCTLRIWRLSGGSLEKALIGHNYFSTCFSPNGKLLASGDNVGTVRLSTMNDLDANCLAVSPYIHRFEEDDDDDDDDDSDDDDDLGAYVCSVNFSPNGQNLASGGYDGNIFLWDTRKFS